MSTSPPPTAPQPYQFRLRSLLLFTVLVAVVGGVYRVALGAEEAGTEQVYGGLLRTLYAFGGGVWAVKWARARGLGGWRLPLWGAVFGGVLATMAYAPLSLPETRAELRYLPARMYGGTSPDLESIIWVTAASRTLHKGFFDGAMIGAATASLTFLSRIGSRRFGELRW